MYLSDIKMWRRCVMLIMLNLIGVMSLITSLSWIGGPLHLECDLSTELLAGSGRYIRNNFIGIKASAFNDKTYLLSPRLKRGVVATVSAVVQGRRGPEFQPYPALRDHTMTDCAALQNAVDFYMDHLGTLWVLDSGIVETMEAPRCTCPAKIVAINVHQEKITRRIDLSPVIEPASVLQSIVVDYALTTKPFIYVSDAARGAVLVHDVGSGSSWSVAVCSPSTGLQLALVKRPVYNTLLIVRVQHPGIVEVDTAILRRAHALAPRRVFAEHTQPIVLLGHDVFSHRVYLRRTSNADVLFWDTRESYNVSRLVTVYAAEPRLTPTSVTTDPLRPTLLVLESNYPETIRTNIPTYHRATHISKFVK